MHGGLGHLKKTCQHIQCDGDSLTSMAAISCSWFKRLRFIISLKIYANVADIVDQYNSHYSLKCSWHCFIIHTSHFECQSGLCEDVELRHEVDTQSEEDEEIGSEKI